MNNYNKDDYYQVGEILDVVERDKRIKRYRQFSKDNVDDILTEIETVVNEELNDSIMNIIKIIFFSDTNEQDHLMLMDEAEKMINEKTNQLFEYYYEKYMKG